MNVAIDKNATLRPGTKPVIARAKPGIVLAMSERRKATQSGWTDDMRGLYRAARRKDATV